MADLEKLRETVTRTEHRFAEATQIVRVARQKLKDAEVDWHKKNYEWSEARAKLLVAEAQLQPTSEKGE